MRTGMWRSRAFADEYFSTMAPVVVGNHLLVGTGNDSDEPGFLQSFDPATGKLQWKRYTVPVSADDPALKTWPSLDAARHGGGQVWMPGSYDPQTDLYITGTGNPTPGYTGIARQGDNLYTCSMLAIRVPPVEIVWYYQTSPHDTHDWDSSQTPILYRWHCRRQTPQAGIHGGAQWLLLHPGSGDRRASRHLQVRHDGKLDQGHQTQWSAGSGSGEIRDHSRIAGVTV